MQNLQEIHVAASWGGSQLLLNERLKKIRQVVKKEGEGFLFDEKQVLEKIIKEVSLIVKSKAIDEGKKLNYKKNFFI